MFLGCGSTDPKFIRKQIENKDVAIKWFFYSYISNTSPDFVVVEKDGKNIELYKADRVIVDVALIDHAIILKLVEPSKGLVYTKKVEDQVFGYKLIVDTTGTYDELRLRPNGVKQND